ncbi:MAG: type III pantothenate kinase [Coriobacteriia bacterium]
MRLAIDVGNTQTVIGLFDEKGLDGHWRISTDDSLTADELGVKLAGLLALEKVGWDDVSGMIVSSVVPNLTEAYEDLSRSVLGGSPLIVGPGVKTGVPIKYDNPHEVGADRIVNAVAAKASFGSPVIVVDFGTATTFDVVDAEGAYLGGAIAPGVETSAEALFARAARLSKVDLEPPARVVGRNTRESVQAGLLLGEAVMVDGLVARIRQEMGADAPVVATGGLAERMAPLCESIQHVDPDLTLKGLIAIWEMNATG